jgi:hypothetical protein
MVETWGKDIFNISEQKYSKNPTNMQVQSSEYDELFIKASKDRVEFFKNKVKNGEVTYKPYTSESSSQKPLAIKAVFKLVLLSMSFVICFTTGIGKHFVG